MGGMGSGRRWVYDKKSTVENCLTLNINKLMRDGLIRPGFYHSGRLVWRRVSTGEETASVGYSVDSLSDDEILFRLNYTIGRDDRKQDIVQPIALRSTNPNYGGKRWWFICPLVKNDRPCNRRAATLHLPPGGVYFGCRSCYDLTYTSCQDSHRFDRLFSRIACDTGLTASAVKRALSGDSL